MRRFTYYTPLVLQKVAFIIFYPLYRFFSRIDIRGREHLRGLTAPVIIALNHTHEIDVTLLPLVAGFFSPLYPIYFVANPIAKYKTFGWRSVLYGATFFRMLGGYSVYSGNKNYEIALEDHCALLRQGRTVCIFPEGKRTLDGAIAPARGGLGYLMHASKATVVPVAIDTFFEMSWTDFLLRRRKVRIIIGKPIPPQTDVRPPEVDEVEWYRRLSQHVLDCVSQMMNSSQ